MQAWQRAVGTCGDGKAGGGGAVVALNPLKAQLVNAVSVYGVVSSTHVTPNGEWG